MFYEICESDAGELLEQCKAMRNEDLAEWGKATAEEEKTDADADREKNFPTEWSGLKGLREVVGKVSGAF